MSLILVAVAVASIPDFKPYFYLEGGSTPIDMGQYAAPCLYDWNGDGYRDLVIGGDYGVLDSLHYYQSYTVEPQMYPSTPWFLEDYLGNPIVYHSFTCIDVVQWDQQYDDDLLYSGGEGLVWCSCGNGVIGGAYQVKYHSSIDETETPIFEYYFDTVDWDNDGDLDLVTGGLNTIYLYINTASSGWPYFLDPTVLYSHASETLHLNPQIVDLDSDGDKDLVVGTNVISAGGINGQIWFYSNIGTDEAPVFSFPWATDTLTAGGQPIMGYSSAYPEIRPVFLDWDLDGQIDLLTSDFGGEVKIWTNPLTGIEDAGSIEISSTTLQVLNPSFGSVQVTLATPDPLTLSLYDISGRRVDTMQAESGTFEFDTVPAGSYIVVAETPTGTVTEQCVVL